MESWLIVIITIATIVIVIWTLKFFIQIWARNKYERLKVNPSSHCDIDTFVNPYHHRRNDNNNYYYKNPVNAVKCVLSHEIQIGNQRQHLSITTPIPLEFYESPYVSGLYVSRRRSSSTTSTSSSSPTDTEDTTTTTTTKDKTKKPKKTTISTTIPTSTTPTYDWDEMVSKSNVSTTNTNDDTVNGVVVTTVLPTVVFTIRMGFGHHRLAYSVSSWAMSMQSSSRTTIFHDLLNFDSPESDLLKSTDALYSKFSRMASEWGGPIEKLWGSMMMQGDANALRIAANVAKHIQPLVLFYPKDTPIITTHQLCALVASAAGFTNVVNLVVDNWPQWFLTVPNTLNIVQGPVNYQCFLQLGIQPEEIQWAGHWCPHDLVHNIVTDCTKRKVRLGQGKPLRILVPVGGAGAQRKFIVEFVRALAPYLQQHRIQLFLNAGDHGHMKTAFLQLLDECNVPFDTVQDITGVRQFQQKLLSHDQNEPNHSVTLFAFDEYFPAVATTDILCRVSDVLCCKPSELAFYCIPKLHIRRVGDHEAASAKRSSELGDGTLEAREVEDALSYLDTFLTSPDMLNSMNDAIMKNHTIGIYDGCRKAVELSIARSSSSTAAVTSTTSKK